MILKNEKDFDDVFDSLLIANEKKESKFSDIKFEVQYFYNNSIVYPIRSFIQGVKNLWYYKSVILE